MEQLNSNEYKLRSAVTEKESELKAITNDREQMGVQLYSLQQQLARLQISLENSHAERTALDSETGSAYVAETTQDLLPSESEQIIGLKRMKFQKSL